MSHAKNNTQQKFPWLMVSLGTIGVLIGYSFFLKGQPEAAMGNGYSCPATPQICQGKNCNENPACKNAGCSVHCPGNCAHPA